MGARDFGRDIEPQSQALLAVLTGHPIERLKQPAHRYSRDRFECDLVAYRAADPALLGDARTAAKSMPVDLQTTSRMRGTAAMPCTAAMSALGSVVMIGA
jgi:hypothetical protein